MAEETNHFYVNPETRAFVLVEKFLEERTEGRRYEAQVFYKGNDCVEIRDKMNVIINSDGILSSKLDNKDCLSGYRRASEKEEIGLIKLVESLFSEKLR